MVMQYIAAITKVSSGLNRFVSTVGNMKTNSSFLKLVFEFLDIPNTMYQGSLTIEKRLDRDYEKNLTTVRKDWLNLKMFHSSIKQAMSMY